MERYQELFHLYVLSGELSKNVSLYYHIGHLFGYSGEELMIILLYSHFSYHISLYSKISGKNIWQNISLHHLSLYFLFNYINTC